MNAIEPLFSQPVAQAIGWALLQFVWQGAVVGLISAAALFALRRSAADVRYVVATIGLSLMVTLPVVSAVQAWRANSAPSPGNANEAFAARANPHDAPEEGGASAVPATFDEPVGPGVAAATPRIARDSRLSLVLVVWLCGVAILSLRLLTGWVWIRRVTTRGVSPASRVLQDIAAHISRRLHITRTVTFLESALVDVPTVVGWVKPMVLVPASALVALTPPQLEAIIAHELAHIRRHDYLVNLLQTLVETLLFYHPAVWWLSRRIRIERENCCDDLAVSLCGDAVVYARALADLEVLRGGRGLALAASGGSLLHRVRRLLGAPTHAGRGPGWLAGMAAVLVIAGIAAGALGRVAFSAEQVVAAAPPAPPVPVRAATAAPEATAPVVATIRPASPATTQSVAVRERPAVAAKVASEPVIAPAGVATVAVQPALASTAERFREASAALASTGVTTAVEATVAQATTRSSSGVQKGNFIWTNDDERIEIQYEGRIEFTDDDTDVKSLSPGGWLRIREGRLLNRTAVEFEADESGNVRRRYWAGSSERPFDPEGRQWLARMLPRFIRQSGIGAADRVARILRTKGVDGVLAEIDLIEGSWAKRVYFSELLKNNPDPAAVERILTRAGRQIDSDFELASLLTSAAERLLVNDATRRAFFDASRSIQSDFEMRRVFSAAVDRGALASDVLAAALLEAGTSIGSDFELATWLLQVVKTQSLDDRSRPAFFKAAAGIQSDFEHRRVLNALAARPSIDAATLNGILESAVLIDSDFEAASLLLTLLDHHSIESANRETFFRAAESLGSPFERGRVLQRLAKRSDVSEDTILGILRATKGMNGNFETAQVLMAIASHQPLKGPARDLYIEVAERLGEFEQGRVLSALVRNERSAK